jgi:hypothetical protein
MGDLPTVIAAPWRGAAWLGGRAIGWTAWTRAAALAVMSVHRMARSRDRIFRGPSTLSHTTTVLRAGA